jgi:hypothetical protein
MLFIVLKRHRNKKSICSLQYLQANCLSAVGTVLDSTGKPVIEPQTRVKTKYGNGCVIEYRSSEQDILDAGTGIYVVELDWKLAGTSTAKAYLQASDITVIPAKMRDLSAEQVVSKAEGMKTKADTFLKGGHVEEAGGMYTQAIGCLWYLKDAQTDRQKAQSLCCMVINMPKLLPLFSSESSSSLYFPRPRPLQTPLVSPPKRFRAT